MADLQRALHELGRAIEQGEQPDYDRLAKLQALDLAAYGAQFAEQVAAEQVAADRHAFGDPPTPTPPSA